MGGDHHLSGLYNPVIHRYKSPTPRTGQRRRRYGQAGGRDERISPPGDQYFSLVAKK